MTKTVTPAGLERAFNRARQDLAAVGLLEEGRYLDRIECGMSFLPSWSTTKGFVYECGAPSLLSWLGYQAGTIYLPAWATYEAHGRGYTLLDVVRHEFGHAWHWLDPKFVGGPWFKRAFGKRYDEQWSEEPDYFEEDYLFAYSLTSPAEDFADTFAMYLKYRNNLGRFAERRPGFHAKLRAIERAVERAAKTRVRRIRGPRAS